MKEADGDCLPFVFLIAGTNLNESDSVSFCALLNPGGIGCVHCTGSDNESYPFLGSSFTCTLSLDKYHQTGLDCNPVRS